jgi:hypothetical protein
MPYKYFLEAPVVPPQQSLRQLSNRKSDTGCGAEAGGRVDGGGGNGGLDHAGLACIMDQPGVGELRAGLPPAGKRMLGALETAVDRSLGL